MGCTEQEKDEFWELLDEAVGKIPCNERVWIGGDLNGHVGEGNTGEEVFVGRFGLGAKKCRRKQNSGICTKNGNGNC